MTTLGDKIRALKLKFDRGGDFTWNSALDRAAALADEHEAELTTARMCGMNAANIALRLKSMGFDANVGVDEDGEWVISVYRDGKPVGCGSSLWDEERREYYWSCYIKFDGREFANGRMGINEVPEGLPSRETDALVAAAYEDAAQKVQARCPKCGGEGWVWGHELEAYTHPHPGQADDTKYSCDGIECSIAAAIRARVPADARAALDRIKAEAEARGMEMAAGICEGIRISIANGPMPEGARFDYEHTILAAAAKHRENPNG